MYLGWDVGIKNLSYCILKKDDNDKIQIIDWDVINLLIHKPPKIYCTYSKKNGITCGRVAKYYSGINADTFCNVHLKVWKKNTLKNTLNDIKEWKDKWCCSQSLCSKVATRYCSNEHLYFCTKHRNVTNTLKDVINQTSATRMPLVTLGKILYEKLDKCPQLLDVENICIENQPVLKNPTMKSIQMMLFSYFIMKKHEKKINLQDMVLMSAKNKLKVYKNQWGECPKEILNIKDKYRKNKKMAIEHTRLFMENEHESWKEFYDNHDKQDDLADSYLMVRYFIEK
jgi:hypothetical protein